VSNRKQSLPVLCTTPYLTLHKLSVYSIRYFVNLSALARNQFVCPDLFISLYALNPFPNKPVSTPPELPFTNCHVRWQASLWIEFVMFCLWA